MTNKQALAILDYEHNEMRTIFQNGEIYFVAKDVCEILEISNHRDALNRLDEDEKGVVTTDTPGGNQTMLCVNESGLYHLIFTSRKEEAKLFRRWVTQEVLPSIRKTGKYSVNPLSLTDSILELLHTFQAEGKGPVTAREIQQRRWVFKHMPVYQVKALLTELTEEGKIANHQGIRTQRYGLPETKEYHR